MGRYKYNLFCALKELLKKALIIFVHLFVLLKLESQKIIKYKDVVKYGERDTHCTSYGQVE